MLLFARRAIFCFCWGLFLTVPAAVFGQTNYYSANGTEYPVIGSLPGDQVFPDAAVTPNGGFVVWQDNITDGSGWGVSARRLDSTLSGTLGTFRVNVQGTNDQENPRVALLKNGGAVFTWQGGAESYQQIYARFLTPTNTWLTTNDVLVNAQASTNLSYSYSTNTTLTITTNWDHAHIRITGYTTNATTTVTTNTIASSSALNFRINPAVAVLNNSNVVVVWASFDQASSSSLQDVYGQILSPAGQKIGGEFLINQFLPYNQRTPTIAPLQNGGFVVAWVSEQERLIAPSLGSNSTYSAASAVVTPSVDIYARLYDGNGIAKTNEFLVNTDSNPCANPSVAAAADGSFMVAWSGRDVVNVTNGWDVYARPFSSTGIGGTTVRLNTYLYGNQYAPRISAVGLDYLAVWTSLRQDGSREGVFRQFVHSDGTLVGGELRVNTTTVSQQMQPVVASDGVDQFIAVWTSYAGSPYSFDLFAQRYIDVSAVLQPMAAPFVNAPFTLSNGVYQPQLQVSWPVLLGISVSNFEIYVNGSSMPMAVTSSNVWTMTAANGLTVGSTNSFQVDYVTTDDRRSPLSPSASGATWNGLNWGGIPFEWMTEYFGSDISKWPSVTADTDGDGMNNLQEFLAGTVPTNSASVLSVELNNSPQGMFLRWPTQPGLTYQVQMKTGLTSSWSNLGAPRFAAGYSDSIYCGAGSSGFYQIELLRQ
ncbi:MAG TPA: hypothetical protein VHY30_08735 [Verrucomicrobiae bacterium]|nr:hypothetical protein [Verrucomicrobiae bacterium]